MTQQRQKELTLTRLFDAPREMVFKAFTDPALLQQWWSPRQFTNTLAELDLRPGGAFLVNMLGPDGVVYPNKGIYREIVQSERLVFTSSAFEDEAGSPLLEVLNTVTFDEENGKTKLSLHAVVIRVTPEAEAALAGMKEGWSQSLDKLAELLE
ncbi:MAG: SRPBCC domain-containing protein [Chloroflexi bacterium]|nr:MAG: SRPBCC domain-containing protein [Chloroflexota bacterium]